MRIIFRKCNPNNVLIEEGGEVNDVCVYVYVRDDTDRQTDF